MKRIIVLLVVATLVLAMSALPASAGSGSGREGGGPPLFSGYVGMTLVLHCQVGGGKSVAVFFAKRDFVGGNCR